MAFDRSFYVPAGAVRIADKASSAVVFVYERDRRPCVVAFRGKAQKPAARYRFPTPVAREKWVREFFGRVRDNETRRRTEREERLAKDRAAVWRVGDLLKSVWGYEQTNVDWFEVTAVSGRYVTVRGIAQERTVEGWERGKCVPLPGQYVGPPLRRLAGSLGVKISSCQFAFRQEPTMVGGVPVYSATDWTSYA